MRYLVMAALTTLLWQGSGVAGESLAGLYRKPNGGITGIAEFHEFGQAEILVDYRTGEAGRLFQLADGRTGVAGAIGADSASPAHVLERKAGALLLDGESMQPTVLKRRSFEAKNESITLAGELVCTEEKPLGVLVFIHGSGDGPRHAYDVWTNFFLSRGWAVVVYDKRGSGQSTGDWHKANFDALADDARSVVRWTRAQDELRNLKVGLWGASQAGWIIPQLAAEGLINFAIVQAGAITPVDDFIRQTLDSELRAYGFPAEEIARAQEYYALDVAVSRAIEPFSVVESAYRKASAEGAEWLLKPPDPPESPDRKFMAAISGFDAADYWRKVRIPLLALFGGKDHVVPAELNRRRLETLLTEAGNTQAQIVTLANDNHLNMLAKTGVRTEYSTLNRFDPVYFETLTKFLDQMAVRGN